MNSKDRASLLRLPNTIIRKQYQLLPITLRRKLKSIPLDDKTFVIIIIALLVYSAIQSVLGISSYYLTFISSVITFGILAMAYNLLHGHTGLISFGHAGFYVTGAYAGALTMLYTSSIWMGFAGTIVGSAVFAFIVGFASVRIRGVYFALLTLSFSMIPFILIRGPLGWLTGGDQGLRIMKYPAFPVDLGNPLTFFFFSLGALVVTYLILRIIISSHYGKCLKCIKDNELKLEGLGYNTRRIKYTAVTISGLLGGLAGYLSVLANLSANVALGTYFVSAKVIFVTLIGGVSSIVGPIIGSFIWNFISEFLVVPGFLEITLGTILLVVILRFPRGLIAIFKKK